MVASGTVSPHPMSHDLSRAGVTLNYRRVLLKLSGEALMGDAPFGIDPAVATSIAAQISRVIARGIEVAVVIGGGNIWRGLSASSKGMDRATADYMGMVATVLNALALQDALEKVDVQTRVMSAIQMHEVAEPYIRRRAIRHMEKGRVVILAAGTGNPYFTTDTAAALRALELDVDVLLMAKNRIDGIYTADPNLDPEARLYRQISHQEAFERDLRVMDAAAFSLCRENNLPILVFNMNTDGSIVQAVSGSPVGTLVAAGETLFAEVVSR